MDDHADAATLSRGARDLVARLDLAPHPEGGFYRETHRSAVVLPAAALPDHDGDRCAVTSILFLLPAGCMSRPHRVRSEEIFLHHAGDPMRLAMSPAEADVFAAADRIEHRLGLEKGASPHVVVPPGWWQAATPEEGPHGFSLVACIVAPGFEFADFEMVER